MGINSIDDATRSLEEQVEELGVRTIFDRFLDSQPECKTGAANLCCKCCSMGPCRIMEKKKRTICGVDKHTIVMWNYSRNITAGVAQHAWHAYYYLDFLRKVLQGNTQFELKGEQIGLAMADALKISEDTPRETLLYLVNLFSVELTGSFRDNRRSRILELLVPPQLLEKWETLSVLPISPMVEIAHTLTRTSLGVESDPVQLALQTIKVGISDLVNEYVALAAHNIIHGPFSIEDSEASFGDLEKHQVNILLHGHVPIMPSVIAELCSDPELLEYAKTKGAEGLNAIGVCCSGNELLARYGIPLIGNFSQQELFIMTGAVDAYVVEQQCVLPTLVNIAQNFHTLVISTDPAASVPGSEHIPVEFDRAYDQGREIISKAIDNFQNRVAGDLSIPPIKHTVKGSYNCDTFLQKVSLDSLIGAIVEGRIKGVVAMAACNNPRIKHNFGIVTVAQNLLKNDILLVATGCAAPGLASAGLMSGEVLSADFVGDGIREFCTTHDIPPALMFGSCVANSHIFLLCKQVAAKLGCEITDLPVAASAPEWMNEKLFPIATYLIAAGLMVHIGPPPPIMGSEKVISIFTKDVKELFNGSLLVEPNPAVASEEIIKYVEAKRSALLSRV